MSVYAYAAAAAIVFLILYFTFVYAAWERWNDYRKLERRAHLNMMRQRGQWHS